MGEAASTPVDKSTFKRRLKHGWSFSFIPHGVQEVKSLDRSAEEAQLYHAGSGVLQSPGVPTFCFGVYGSYG